MSRKLSGQFKSELKTAKTNRPFSMLLLLFSFSSFRIPDSCHRWIHMRIRAVLEADGWAHLAPLELQLWVPVGKGMGPVQRIHEAQTWVKITCGTCCVARTTLRLSAMRLAFFSRDPVRKYWFVGVHDLQNWRLYVINQDVCMHQWGSCVEWLQ